ncbi:hypothetical protein GALMADRAFT_245693 [Galerina marginata CBS 339.88]|uniref:Uncharacterized protein n=1 Tax=Galerina marginata (strain CBS 339.88) TaxID=685588 RepID=A0A067T343_GALM3|nr:hypothetical protein GALMADRAFT_245693 [Galerina marginata CBS 339.88]
MHQSHNIPWSILSSNYHFVRANKELNPTTHMYTGILPIPIPTERTHGHGPQELKHLIRKFADTIRLFSTTERLKIKSAPAGSETDSSLIILAQCGKKLFPASLLLKHPSILTEQNQKPEHWYDFKSRSFIPLPGNPKGPGEGEGGGDQVLRILLHSPSTPTATLLFPGHARSQDTQAEPPPRSLPTFSSTPQTPSAHWRRGSTPRRIITASSSPSWRMRRMCAGRRRRRCIRRSSGNAAC